MYNDITNIPMRDINDKLDFSDNLGKWGFIIPNNIKYKDTVFYMPAIESTKENGIHHAKLLKYMLIKLFKEEKNEAFDKYKSCAFREEEAIYMDSEEIAISSFISSLNCIVFLNTSDNIFSSGITFIPEEVEAKNENKNFKEILKYLYEGNDLTSQIVIVPSLNDTINNKKRIKAFDLSEYQEYINNKNKEYK